MRAWFVVGAAAVIVAGCGVPTQEDATPLPSGALPPTPTAPPTAPTEAVAGAELWFVSDNALVSARVPVADGTPQALLDALAVGPPAGSPDSVRSLLVDPTAGGALLSVTAPAPGTPTAGVVTVSVTDAFTSLPANEQVLLLGQVVLTLTAAGADAVLVTDSQGAPLAVPLPDGRLLDRPATEVDYRALVGATG